MGVVGSQVKPISLLLMLKVCRRPGPTNKSMHSRRIDASPTEVQNAQKWVENLLIGSQFKGILGMQIKMI